MLAQLRVFSVTKRTVNRMLTIVKYLIDDEVNYTFADSDEGIEIGTLTESRDLDNVPFWHGIIDTYVIMIDDDDDLIRQFENDSFFLHRFGLRFDSVILLDEIDHIGKVIK